MAYRLKKIESVPDGLKRIVLEEIESAMHGLAQSDNRDEAIHEARKSLKKIRGVVRLVQPELGRIYRRENEQIGAIGRRLSELRDATAMLEVFDGLVQKYGGNLRDNALASIRLGLQQAKHNTEEAANADQAVQRTLATLRAVRSRVQDWPLKQNGFSALAPGLKDRYRRGRQAMAAALKRQTSDSYHEWRKRVKDHWYHLRLLQAVWNEPVKAQEARLKDLETWLGDDHNLTVLVDRVQRDPDPFGEVATRDLFLALAAQRQRELRQQAQQLGAEVYGKKAGQMTHELAKLWDDWHARPPATAKKDAKSEQTKARKAAAA